MAPRAFKGCVECGGKKGLPRNGLRGATCSAHSCKSAYATKRKASAAADAAELASDEAAPVPSEMMPSGMWVADLEEILGERCCEVRNLTHKKRKNGPGTSYRQQYLVRGKFLEDDGDEDDDEDDSPEPNTFWVDEVDLLETISKEDIKDALNLRHERVIGDL
jgi:hypothetical protein